MILNTFNKNKVIEVFENLKSKSNNDLITDSAFCLTIDEAKEKDYLILFYSDHLHRLDIKEFDPNKTHFTSLVKMFPLLEFEKEVLKGKFKSFEN